jgi:hypothetical protein
MITLFKPAEAWRVFPDPAALLRERVHYHDPVIDLEVAHVLGEEEPGPCLPRRGDNGGVPIG